MKHGGLRASEVDNADYVFSSNPAAQDTLRYIYILNNMNVMHKYIYNFIWCDEYMKFNENELQIEKNCQSKGSL